MPLPTPFHTRTAPLNRSREWRDWAGYLAVGVYEKSHEREYVAIRNSAALIDVSPLFKYDVTGPDALRLVDRIVTRDITRCRVGQVMYTPWCNEDGHILDDGTVMRLDENHFRITAVDANLRWFQDVGYGLDARVTDISTQLAALALQGPNSRAILRRLISGLDLDALPIFRAAQGSIDGRSLTLTRTGYTGDLGYELWLHPGSAEHIWDRLITAGAAYGLLPAGMVALDIARIEAGFLLAEIDYISARHARLPDQKSTPYELGLGWTVNLDGADFIGKKALQAIQRREAEAQRNPTVHAFVGVAVAWPELERVYGETGLRPQVAGARASRSPLLIYADGRQVGQLTSHTYAPLLRRYVGIGTVEREFAENGRPLQLEMTINYRRRYAAGVVTPTPFYNPPHKKT